MDEDTRPEPVDQAWAVAEALLADDAARVRRRARVLAAVARIEPTPARGRRSARGGWLAAAAVAGLSVFVAIQIQQRPPVHAPAPPAARTAQTGDTTAADAARAPPQAAVSPPPPPSPSAAPRVLARAPEAASAAADRPAAPSGAVAEKSAVGTSNAAAAKPGASADAGFAREEARAAGARPSYTAGHLGSPLGGIAPPPPPAPAAAPATSIASPSDRGDQLRAAAAAGRSDDVADLLAQGAPVDAQDVNGDTALMKSVRAGRIETAALLRRRGASLDRKNRAGLSVRDVAATLNNPRLDQAIGVKPRP